MTEDEALKAAYLAGFNASGEGYNGEYPFHGAHPEQDAGWIKNRDNEITAIKQARALDKMAENARELGLDYEPVDGTQVSKVWWDGEKLMAKPIPLEDFYLPTPVQPVQEPVGCMRCATPKKCATWGCSPNTWPSENTTPPATQPAPTVQPVAQLGDGVLWCDTCRSVQETIHHTSPNDRDVWCKGEAAWLQGPFYTTPPAAQLAPVLLTERELELIDGMIEVQLDHAKRCDSIANRTMAEKQKGWDMERVALLQKLKKGNT